MAMAALCFYTTNFFKGKKNYLRAAIPASLESQNFQDLLMAGDLMSAKKYKWKIQNIVTYILIWAWP